jgi:hypothetical protein
MAKTGRSPYTTSDVASFGLESRRLTPPAGLGEAERRVFLDLVTTVPAGQFQPCDLPLLCAWAETVALRERMAARMEVEGELDEKGKPSGAFTIHREATKTMNALALRLRVSSQSRAQKAPRREVAAGYYDRLQLEMDAEEQRGGDEG